jgi:hypothetical protein
MVKKYEKVNMLDNQKKLIQNCHRTLQNIVTSMSISTKLLAVAGILSFSASLIATPVANATQTITAPLTSSSSSFTYCTYDAPYYTVSDIEAAKRVSGSQAFFKVAKNDSISVINGQCQLAGIVTNYVPYIAGHKTSVTLDSAGYPTDVKISNTAPTVKDVTCDGNKTVIRFMDKEEDTLKLTTTVGADDFTTPTTSTDSNGVLKVTLDRKNNDFVGSNSVTMYISEELRSGSDIRYGVSSYSGSSATPPAGRDAEISEKLSTSKLTLTVKGVCDASAYNTSSSSSSMMSSSMMKSSMVAVSDGAGKGMLTRTGGAN